MTITCQVCGTANPDNTTYCEGCGVELTTATAAAPAEAPVTPATPDSETMPAPVETPVETPPLEPVTASEPVAFTPTEVPTPETPAHEVVATDTTASTPSSTGEPVVADSATAPDAAAPATESAPAAVSAPDSAAPDSSAQAETPAETAPVAAAPVAVPATPAPTASTGEAKLGIKKFGAPTGDFIPLQGDHMVVGRFDASTGPVDIDLSGLGGQEHISRRHAELYRENGGWHVRDLGSTNGVYIKHKNESAFSPRLQEPAALADGDEIAFGNLMMTFHQS